ncbi:hypothetical protein Bbelb_146140 [Branchiostoma belcheri]|nr:hypothetical protein Bbelb_146140 [Branchiostoma belcheri]
MGSFPSKSKKKEEKQGKNQSPKSTPEEVRRKVPRRTARRASAVPGLDTIQDDPDEEDAGSWVFGGGSSERANLNIADVTEGADVSDWSRSSDHSITPDIPTSRSSEQV